MVSTSLLRSPVARSFAAITGVAALAITLSACAAPSVGSARQPGAGETDAKPAAVADESRTTELPRLTVAAASEAAEAALAACQAEGTGFVTVAVVDRFGQVQAMLRGDGAAAHTIDAATQKGYTAAAWGVPTSELAQRVGDGAELLRDLDGTLFLPGGVPVTLGKATIAGIGVGGAPDGAVDETCAAAGAAVLADAAAAAAS